MRSLHPGLEVRDSAIDGHGLFATRKFGSGEHLRVSFSVSQQVTMTDEKFHEYVRSVETWDAVALGDGRHLVTLGSRNDNPANFGNHGCEPNVRLVGAELQALRDIEPGEELLINYADLSPKTWSMNCHCGATACRGTVVGRR